MKRKSIENDKLACLLAKIGSDLSLKFIDLDIDYLVLEKKTGMSRAKIKRIFSGSQDFRASEIYKLCDVLGVDFADIWKGGD